MVISPVINGFGALFFLLSAMVYKYLYIWVMDQPADSDTGGLFFPKAITHVFVGIYIQEVCLCTLFFLARDTKDNVSALPQAILMIILIVCTVSVLFSAMYMLMGIGCGALCSHRIVWTSDECATARSCASVLWDAEGSRTRRQPDRG
jgi:hypothetical protein